MTIQAAKRQYNISDANSRYLIAFQQSKYPDLTDKKQYNSFAQYKCTINNFLEYIDKDIAQITPGDIEQFIDAYDGSTRKNKIAHIKTFLTHIITVNFENSREKISKDIFIHLLNL